MTRHRGQVAQVPLTTPSRRSPARCITSQIGPPKAVIPIATKTLPIAQLSTSANVVLNTGGTLDLNGRSLTMNTLTGAGTVTNTAPSVAARASPRPRAVGRPTAGDDPHRGRRTCRGRARTGAARPPALTIQIGLVGVLRR